MAYAGLRASIDSFKRGMEQFIQMVTQKGVKVVYRGKECHTDGKLIVVPALELLQKPHMTREDVKEAEKFLIMLRGKLFHEGAHVIYTTKDMKDVIALERNGKRPSGYHVVVNLVEDVWINKMIGDQFPGAKESLEFMIRWMDKQNAVGISEGKADLFQMRILAALCIAERNPESPTFKAVPPDVQRLVMSLKGTLEQAVNCRSTTEAMALADKLLALLEPPPLQKPNPKGQPGKKGKEGKEKGEEKQKGKGQDDEGDPGEGGEGENDDEKKPKGKGKEKDKGGKGKGKGKGEDDEDGQEGDDEDEKPKKGKGKKGKEPEPEEGEEDDDEGGDGSGEDEKAGDGDPDPEDEHGDGEGGDAGGDGEEEEEDGGGTGEGEEESAEEDGEGEGGGIEGDEGDAGGDPQQAMDEFAKATKRGGDLMNKAIEDYVEQKAEERTAREGYTPFTTEFDQNVSFKEFEAHKINSGTYGSYLRLRSEEDAIRDAADLSNMSRDVEWRVRNKLMARTLSAKVGDMEDGKLEPSKFYRVPMGVQRIFSTQTESLSYRDTTAMLLIDISGSMREGAKMRYARETAYVFGNVLAANKIPFAVGAFTFNNSVGSYGEPPGFSRYGGVLNIMVKDFFEEWNATKLRCLRLDPTLCNLDSESVKWAGHQLMKQREKRKILFVLSDGRPRTEDGPNHNEQIPVLEEHLREVIASLETHGVETFGIGVVDHTVQSFYKNCAVVEDIEKLPEVVSGNLSTVLMAGALRGRGNQQMG